ncbi:MAG: FtsQ-type POTRA domain-containing protein [Terriglobales bacterium]
MARKSSSTAVEEEFYSLPRDVSQHRASEPELFDDSRLVDLEAEQESQFLRGQKRVAVRRVSLPKKAAHRLLWMMGALVILALVGAAGAGLYDYGKHSWRFRIDSSDQIEVTGAEHVSRAQIMETMGGDIGRNIFFVPLSQRQQQLEQIPWVESASVMRFVPNRLRIEVHERTPVAFVRIGPHLSLIDAGGMLMEMTPGSKRKYSFPAIAGMNAGEPLSTRAARMKNYNNLVRELDSGGAHYSQELSEVDLSDPEDVKVLAADSNGEVLVHLGSGNYLQRYKTYVTHVQQWRQQFDRLESVDLRYDGQIIVNPDLEGKARQPALMPTASKSPISAGVKTAAIVSPEKHVAHAPPSKLVPAKKDAKPVAATKPATKPTTKPAVHRAAAHPTPANHAAVKATPVKPAPVNPIALKPKPQAAAVTVANNAPAPHSAAPQTAPPPASTVPVAAGQKKPSAGIPKETPQN